MLGTTATVKVFIDVFIGIWAFILAYIWTNHINVQPGGEHARAVEIWQRFPKFILGFVRDLRGGAGAGAAPRRRERCRRLTAGDRRGQQRSG